MMRFITTSWDDGHPADIRLAELLGKYGLNGTFYIPRFNDEHIVMDENEIHELSKNFEVGGHTLHHKNLVVLGENEVVHEVKGCFDWLQDVLKSEPVCFCPPYGKYSSASLSIIASAGFKLVRTTELLSPILNLPVLPTTIQVYDHSRFTYFRHLVKRRKLWNMALWARSGFSSDIFRLLEYYMNFIALNDGCLHLWGHSWEIDACNGWNRLEQIFKFISSQTGFLYVQNRDLIFN